jgi:tetratricopeptide (TPR) repeat protein
LSLKEIIHKGNEYFYKKEYDKAIECYDNAIEINPKTAYTWDQKSWTLVKLGRYDEAIKCCDKALELDPNNANAFYNRHVLRLKNLI